MLAAPDPSPWIISACHPADRGPDRHLSVRSRTRLPTRDACRALRTGTRGDDEPDGSELRRRQHLTEDEVAGRGRHGRLQAHQDAERPRGDPAQGGELERVRQRRREQRDSEAEEECVRGEDPWPGRDQTALLRDGADGAGDVYLQSVTAFDEAVRAGKPEWRGVRTSRWTYAETAGRGCCSTTSRTPGRSTISTTVGGAAERARGRGRRRRRCRGWCCGCGGAGVGGP